MILRVDGDGCGHGHIKKIEVCIKSLDVIAKNTILGYDFDHLQVPNKPKKIENIGDEEVSIGVDGNRGWPIKAVLVCAHRSLGGRSRQIGVELYNLLVACIGNVNCPVRCDRYRLGVVITRADRLLRVDHDRGRLPEGARRG